MAQQQQQGGDNSLAAIWITGLFIVVGYVLWMLWHKYVVSFFFGLNLIQAKLITLFVNDPKLNYAVGIMKTVDTNSITLTQLIDLIGEIGIYMRYPVALILAIFAVIVYFSNVKLKFKRVHDMRTLRAQEQVNWQAIMPIIKEDLISADINRGPWAMALNPLEFAGKYNLLKKADPVIDDISPGANMTAGLRLGDAKRVFTMQLGPYFDKVEACSPMVIALMAAFMARINRDRASSALILNGINQTWSVGKPDYSIARPILKKHMDSDLVQKVISRHAYLLTVIASLLEAARADGVVPSAEFLWLKFVDRRLWYMLNCVGRQTPFAEVSGPFAHWRAEKVLGRRSLVPMIDEAIKALEIAIKDVKLSEEVLQGLKP
ncbi:MAG: phosphoesterase [Legionellales bacterium RIFCSPHIGHO2_12_FULL_42_9]|nr:MAG: phosphoesterase [Legionellales bacterium RIFCSPHIGHO2_12_FULL_42_9]